MKHSRLDTALLLARTTRHLRPAQVLHRARLRAQRFPPARPLAAALIEALPERAPTIAGWPAAFVPLDLQVAEGFPSAEDNAGGRFTFLNTERDLGRPIGWDPEGESRLWTYHLHYLEWAWSFAAHPDRGWAREEFAALWRSWAGAGRFGQGDRWSPYVASLRAWSLCGTYEALSRGSGIQPAVDAALARHARFLRWHLEHDVGGNHLVKNLKALIGLGVLLGDERLVGTATGELRRQIGVQVLADGGHYERSPSYHCQVLADFIDIAALLDADGRPPVPGLAEAVESMRSWLGLMLLPDGDVPLFNDCVLVGRRRIAALRPGPPATERLTVLGASGYVVARTDRLHLVADVGDPCPPDLPAHAHADCLSFELAADGRRVVVDPGTSTYTEGAQRTHERSTAAHNTVAVDGADQSEVWGAFRAGRRARGRLLAAGDDGELVRVVASHDGYRRLPGSPVHRREWVVGDHVEITDEISGAGAHLVESRVRCCEPGAVKVAWSGPEDLAVSEGAGSYATGFGTVHDGHVTSATWQGTLPVTIRVELHADAVPQAKGAGEEPATKGKA